MKATDLMIGDWISYIPEIAEGEDSYLGEPHNIQVDLSCLQKVDELIFVSIPLTPEILEKNGWKRNKIFMDMKAGENINFSWTDMYGESLFQNGYHMCDCKYVHTLQHALRLCGLNELADNFKV